MQVQGFPWFTKIVYEHRKTYNLIAIKVLVIGKCVTRGLLENVSHDIKLVHVCTN